MILVQLVERGTLMGNHAAQIKGTPVVCASCGGVHGGLRKMDTNYYVCNDKVACDNAVLVQKAEQAEKDNILSQAKPIKVRKPRAKKVKETADVQ
jgi:hypothetical protein